MEFFHRHLIAVMGEKNGCCFFMITNKIHTAESKLHQTDNTISSSYLCACLKLDRFIQIKFKSNTSVNGLEMVSSSSVVSVICTFMWIHWLVSKCNLVELGEQFQKAPRKHFGDFLMKGKLDDISL